MSGWYEIDESYRNMDDVDEWGCVFINLDDTDGAEYNYCIDSGTNSCAIYGFTLIEDSYLTDHHHFRHYEIEWDEPDWLHKLMKAMEEFAIEWKAKYKEQFLKEVTWQDFMDR